MTSKTTRLLAQLDDTEARELVAELAELPGTDVDAICRALRAARKAGRADESARRQQLRRDRANQRNRKDDDKIIYAAQSLLKSLATRGGYTLETLAELRQLVDVDGPKAITAAVHGARAQGYSDAEIGRALGVTSEAIGQRYGRRNTATADRSPQSRTA